MYFLFTDETNVSPKHDARIKFFVYGGLIIPFENLSKLDEGITKIRLESGYEATDSLKFDTNSKPKRISASAFSDIKNKIIDLCIVCDCKFLTYVVLHEIAKKQNLNNTIKWGADHIVSKFDYFLNLKKAKGIVIVDRFSNEGEYKFLSEKFTRGLIYPNKTVPLNNIRLYASSCDNASNLNSAMDIVLGSFRYCINQPKNETSAKTMMKNIIKLLWADRNDKYVNPYEKGLTLRPRERTNPLFEKEYLDLISEINSLLI